MTSDLADVATRDAPQLRKPSPSTREGKKKTLGKVAPIQKSLMSGGR